MTADEPTLELPGLVRDKVREGRVRAARTRARNLADAEIVDHAPVARVLLDLAPAHLDRLFDYGVPASMADGVRPGVRVKVRFAGRDVDGYVVDRVAHSDHPGRLQPLRRLVSDEPVLTTAVMGLAGDVAERYAGTRADVLRLAIPPRHAAAEKEAAPAVAATPPVRDPVAADAAWDGHEPGAAYLRHLAAGERPRAVWQTAPGTDWPLLLAHAVAAALASGRGALVCVPAGRDVDRVGAAVAAVCGEENLVRLRADSGPAQRYRDFLKISRGQVRAVVGTRAAAFAPVTDLGLVAMWDDGDPWHAEPRAPYPHSREVLLLRSRREGAAVLLGSPARSVEADHLVRTGWAHEIRPTRQLVRARGRVSITGATDRDLERDPHTRSSRVPREAHLLIREALAEGPVLLQTPRRGYAAALACDRCRTPARCGHCHGPLKLGAATDPPTCGWCARVEDAWRCPTCAGGGLRAPVVGASRTAEEMGRAFPGVPVVTSSGEHIQDEVAARPTIVVATPGAEPVAESGYAGVVLLDTWLLSADVDLRADEEALRRWSHAVALLAPGGRAAAVGEPGAGVLQALVRWDQPGFAEREAAVRQEAHLPPATRVATITGTPGSLDDVVALLALPQTGEVLGPVEVPADRHGRVQARLVVRVPRRDGAAMSAALGELQRLRSARKLETVRVQIDPLTL